MPGIPKKLARALDKLLETVNDPQCEDNDIILEAMHVLQASGRTPNVWRDEPGASE